MGELVQTVFQRALAIGLVEKACVGEPGIRDERVSVGRIAVEVGVVVDHGEKRIGQLAGTVANGKLLLVNAHDRHQDLFRKLKVLRAELSAQNAGILRQILPLRPDGRVGRWHAFHLHRQDAGALGHDLTAPRSINHHTCELEFRHIVVVRLDLDDLRRQRPVTHGGGAGCHSEDGDRKRRSIEQREHRVNGADVEMLAVPPSHHLRPAERLHHRRNLLLQNFGRGTSSDDAPDPNVVAARNHPFDRGLILFQKSEEGRSGSTSSVVGCADGRPLELLIAIRFPLGELREKKRNAPRGTADQWGLFVAPEVADDLPQELLESGLRRLVHPCRDFLGEKLEGVFRHGCPPIIRGERIGSWRPLFSHHRRLLQERESEGFPG